VPFEYKPFVKFSIEECDPDPDRGDYVLVFIVMYLFLQNFAHVFPTLAVPVWIVAGTISGVGWRPWVFDSTPLTDVGAGGDWRWSVGGMTRLLSSKMSERIMETGHIGPLEVDGKIDWTQDTGALIASLWFCLAVFVPMGYFPRLDGVHLQGSFSITIISAMTLSVGGGLL